MTSLQFLTFELVFLFNILPLFLLFLSWEEKRTIRKVIKESRRNKEIYAKWRQAECK